MRHLIWILPLLLEGCRYSGPCELQARFDGPTKLDSNPALLTRGLGSPGEGFNQFVVTGVEAQVAFDFATRCDWDDPRLTQAKIRVLSPSGREQPGVLKFAPDIRPYDGKTTITKKDSVVGRLFYTPDVPGMHAVHLDFGAEGVGSREIFVSRGHAWEERVATLPRRCMHVQRTALGTWFCDHVAFQGENKVREWPGAAVRTDGKFVYVWHDDALEVWLETAAGVFALTQSLPHGEPWQSRRQIAPADGRLLLVSNSLLRLFEFRQGKLELLQSAPPPLASFTSPEESGGGQSRRNQWGVSFDGRRHLMVGLAPLDAGTGREERQVQLCALDSDRAFAATHCVFDQDGAVGVSEKGIWVKFGSIDYGYFYDAVDAGVVKQLTVRDTFELPGLFDYYPLLNGFTQREGADAGARIDFFGARVRNSPRARAGANVCSVAKILPDGGFEQQVYPEDLETELTHGVWCDASTDWVWYSAVPEDDHRTFVFPR